MKGGARFDFFPFAVWTEFRRPKASLALYNPRGICLFDEWFPHCWGIYTPKNESIETKKMWPTFGVVLVTEYPMYFAASLSGAKGAWLHGMPGPSSWMSSLTAVWAVPDRTETMKQLEWCSQFLWGAWRAFDCSTVQFFSFFIDFPLFFLSRFGVNSVCLPLTVCFSTSKHLWMVGMSDHLLHGCHHVSGRWYLLTIAFPCWAIQP